jgi:hypothetical protein
MASASLVRLGELVVVKSVVLLVRACGSRGGGSGRWIVRSALRRAALRWWWLISLVVWAARSGQRGILGLVVFRQWRLPDHALEVRFGVGGRTTVLRCGGGDFGRKSSALAPAATTPVGVVTLLGALLWLPPKHQCSG